MSFRGLVSSAASGAPASIVAGGTVNFTATGAGGSGTFTYVWTFGDGNHSTLATVAHVYAKAGNYTAHVWVNDSLGGSYTHSFAITVTAAGGNGGGSGSSTSSSLPGWAIWAVLGLIIVVIAAIAVVMMMRRKKSNPPPSSPPMGAASGGPANPPPGAQ